MLRSLRGAADRRSVYRIPPVAAAGTLLRRGVDEQAVVAYLRRRWSLSEVEASAAVATVYTLAVNGDHVAVARHWATGAAPGTAAWRER
jgi:hypothetical protein